MGRPEIDPLRRPGWIRPRGQGRADRIAGQRYERVSRSVGRVLCRRLSNLDRCGQHAV